MVVGVLLLNGCASYTSDFMASQSGIGLYRLAEKAGYDFNTRLDNGDTLLIDAIKRGDDEKFSYLLDARVNLELADSSGRTALYHAIVDNQHGFIKRLVEAGADIEAVVYDAKFASAARTLLWHAYVYADPSTQELLMSLGASQETITAAHWAEVACAGIGDPGYSAEALRTAVERSDPGFRCAGKPATHYAVDVDNTAALALLLDRGKKGKETRAAQKDIAGYALIQRKGRSLEYLAKRGIKPSVSEELALQIVASSSADEIPYELLGGLKRSSRHAVACALLQKSGNGKSQDEYVAKHLQVDTKCPGGEYPIHLVMSNRSRFDALMAKNPKLAVKNAKGETPLQAALRADNGHAVGALLKKGISARNLTYSDVKPVASNKEVMKSLEAAGLRKSIRAGAEAERLCKEASFDYSKSPLYQPFYKATWKLSQEYHDDRAASEEIVEQFRQCLESNKAIVDGIVPYSGGWTSQPYLGDKIFGSSKIRLLQGLSHLSSRDIKKQDVRKAAELINASFSELDANINEFMAAANGYVQHQNSEIARQRDAAETRAWVGILANTAVGLYGASKGYNQVVNVAQQQLAMIPVTLQQELDQLSSMKIERVEVPRSVKLEDDGVRFYVPRFGAANPHGMLESEFSLNHTRKVVKIYTTGICTGAVLSGQRILTAQHCLLNDNGQWAKKISVRQEYLDTPFLERGEVSSNSYDGPWKITTSKGVWLGDNFQHDWAILEPAKKLDNPPYFLKSGLDLATAQQYDAYVAGNKQDNRLAIAGYSTHLSQGKYLTMDWGCQIRSGGDVYLWHRCKGWKGDSGSPVVAINGRLKSVVLGVHVAGFSSFKAGDDPRTAPADRRWAVSAKQVRAQQAGYSRVLYVN